MLQVNKDKKEGYLIHTTNNNKYLLCKIIKEYDDKQKAINGLLEKLKK